MFCPPPKNSGRVGGAKHPDATGSIPWAFLSLFRVLFLQALTFVVVTLRRGEVKGTSQWPGWAAIIYHHEEVNDESHIKKTVACFNT